MLLLTLFWFLSPTFLGALQCKTRISVLEKEKFDFNFSFRSGSLIAKQIFWKKRSLVAKRCNFPSFPPPLTPVLQLTQAIWLQNDKIIITTITLIWRGDDYEDVEGSSDLIAVLTQLVHPLGKYLNDSIFWLVIWWQRWWLWWLSYKLPMISYMMMILRTIISIRMLLIVILVWLNIYLTILICSKDMTFLLTVWSWWQW